MTPEPNDQERNAPATIRCFTGIPVTPECREVYAVVRKRLQGKVRSRASWVRPENQHLTLKFLGDVLTNDVDKVTRALSGVRFRPFAVRIGPGGFFPNDRKPRVVWSGLLAGAGECSALFRELEDVLAPAGFAPEPRPFSPHLTLARIRRNEPDDWNRVRDILDRTEWPDFTADRFVLWQSVLGPQGPTYRIIKEFLADGV